MVFSSTIFVFLFLPVTLLLYWAAPKILRNSALLLASVLFYAFGELQHLALLGLSLLLNYLGGRIIGLRLGKHRLTALWTFVLVNLAGLVWFKYSGFLASSTNSLAATMGWDINLPVPAFALPLGISFFTFHAISYLVDVYRDKVPPQNDPVAFALYILLFPQLIAGPIIRYHDIAAQLQHRSVGVDDFAEGVRRFLVGSGKKLLLANPMGTVADAVFANSGAELSTAAVWLGAVAYSLQIYLDFSAYSDMAIGLCRMFGFRIRENFNHPYIAESIQDFWRRWHISLSTWFRDYVYIPLGGNRCGGLRTAAHLLIVFVLCGLWHGAQWTFLFWGLYHGVFLALERTSFGQVLAHWPRILRHAYALLIVVLGWVLFRADSAAQAGAFITRMFWLQPGRGWGEFIDGFGLVVMLVAALAAVPWWGSRLFDMTPGSHIIQQVRTSAMLFLLAAACYVALFSSTYNPFIYFRF